MKKEYRYVKIYVAISCAAGPPKGEKEELRKYRIFLLMAVILICLPAAVLAQTYTFGDVRASVDIPAEYETVLTPYNLATQGEYLAAQGKDAETLQAEFAAEGVLLMAIDAETDRTLVITALKDVDAQTYFDLNLQDEDMRKEFRVSHSNGSAYGVLGYSYTDKKPEWKNYGGDTLRFLVTKYSLRQEGQLVCTGYQRRTIRNGYTITLDMQVRGRMAKENDNDALEAVMKTWQFTEILPMPALPIKLTVSSAPPASTNEGTFTITGSTQKKATVTATVFSMGKANGETFTTVANNSGNFSLPVKLSSQGVYSLTLTAEAPDAIAAKRQYKISYRKNELPVEITAAPPAVLSDETLVAGSTIAGAKIQLAVSGPAEYVRSTTGKTFSFKVDTSAEGTYHFVLSVNKKGMEEQVFTYTASRTYSDLERRDRIRESARRIDYKNLAKNEYQGRTAKETGYVTSVTQTISEWVVTLALTKTNAGNYKEIIYVICQEEPGVTTDAQVTVYGQTAGAYSVLNEEGNVKVYPRMNAYFFDQ